MNIAAQMQGYHVDYVSTLEEAETALIPTQQYNGLRFCLYQQPVKHRRGSDHGGGYLPDMSTNRCATLSAALPLTAGDGIFFKTAFTKQHDLLDVFENKATVVWIEKNTFAVKFEDVKNDLREQSWKRLVYEAQCEIA